jgi:hypothetical protein
MPHLRCCHCETADHEIPFRTGLISKKPGVLQKPHSRSGVARPVLGFISVFRLLASDQLRRLHERHRPCHPIQMHFCRPQGGYCTWPRQKDGCAATFDGLRAAWAKLRLRCASRPRLQEKSFGSDESADSLLRSPSRSAKRGHVCSFQRLSLTGSVTAKRRPGRAEICG